VAPANIAEAIAAGQAAAAAIKRLPGDPLDTVARHEVALNAHGIAPYAKPGTASKPGVKSRKRRNVAAVAAAASRASDAAAVVPDHVARPQPTVEMLKQML
jgi:hypothetical protein